MPRILRVIGPAALLLAAAVAMIAALAFGGGAAAPLLADPGALVRWGLPAATLVVNLSLAGTVGTLVLACFAFSPDRDEYGTALDFAAGRAAVMTGASAATGVFTFVTVLNVIMLQTTSTWAISWQDVVNGLSFRLSPASEPLP